MRLPPGKTQPPTRHFRLPLGQPPHFEAKRGSGGRARRISVCRKTQRARDPREHNHSTNRPLKAVVFCPPAIARPYTSRVAGHAGRPVAGDLPGNVPSHIVVPQYHLKRSMAGESPDVAEIAASIEGRCCRAVSQAMGANVPGQARGLAQPSHDPADRFPGESDVRGRLGGRRGDGRAGRVRCRGPRSTRPGRRPFDRAGSCALSRSGLSPESRPRRGGPTPQAGFPRSGLDVHPIEVA